MEAKDEELYKQRKEIAELKDENERLRTALAAVSAPQAFSLDLGPFRFLDLPAELRNAVYELCLMKGTVYLTPRPAHDHTYDGIDIKSLEKPEWALLSLNRQIRGEAAKILLSENHFVFSYDRDTRQYFCTPDPNGDSFYQPIGLRLLSYHHLRSVSITLDVRDFGKDILELADQFSDIIEDRDIKGNNNAIWMAHGGLDFLAGSWEHFLKALCNTKKLQIDITNAFCALGCHWYTEEAARAIPFALHSSENSRKPDLEILGTKNAEERALIKQYLKEAILESPPSANTLQFRGSKCTRECMQIHSHNLDDDLGAEEITFADLRQST